MSCLATDGPRVPSTSSPKHDSNGLNTAFHYWPHSYTHQTTTTSVQNGKPPPATTVSSKRNVSSYTSSHTSKSNREWRGQQDENDDDNGPPNKRPNLDNTRSAPALRRKLACPYYQRNPEKHRNHRACAGPGWADVHRLK